MSERKLFGLLSGAQVTVLGCVALLSPTALFAVTTFSNVALVNPTSGVAANIDPSGNLFVKNPYTIYRDYPSFQIEIAFTNSVSGCNTSQWAVPTGKAFVITAISGYEHQGVGNTLYTGFAPYSGAGCTGNMLTAHLTTTPINQNVYMPFSVSYGVGIPVAAGSTISMFSFNNNGQTFVHGYLVPAAWITASQYVTEGANSGAAPDR